MVLTIFQLVFLVLLGKNGIESIVELDLNAAESDKMQTSADAVRKTNGLLEETVS